MNIRVTFLFLTIVLLGGCVSADLGVSRRANTVQIGYTKQQVREIMGMPQISISNPNNDNMVYAHYCVFSWSADENGFFFYKDSVYKKIQRNITDGFTSRRQHGVWYDFSDMSYDGLCYDEIRVDWNYVEVPTELIAERRDAQQTRQAALEAQRAREAQIVSQDYFIDGLVIVHTQDTGAECASGGDYKIEVRGDIGPDSSFALEELLRRSPIVFRKIGKSKVERLLNWSR